MNLSDVQMQQILDYNLDLIEDDPGAVSLEFELDADEEVVGLLLVHVDPDRAKARPGDRSTVVDGEEIVLPLRIVKGAEPEDDVGGPEDEPPLDDDVGLHHTLGMSGTTVRKGTSWGTLCLSGSRISIVLEGTRKCALDEPFLLSNSHIFDEAGARIRSVNDRHLGTATCVYSLEKKKTFDAGIARGTGALDPSHAFILFNPEGHPRQLQGLKTVRTGWKIFKQGAKTGWTKGKVGSPIRTRVKGHKAIYPAWRGTYRSLPGDSGSPVVYQEAGKWYLVGIHFASGPSFHSWNNAAVVAGP